MDRGRSRKEVRVDQNNAYDSMEYGSPSETAVAAFNRPAYSSVSTLEYLAKKYKIGGKSDGDDETEVEAVQGTLERAEDQ